RAVARRRAWDGRVAALEDDRFGGKRVDGRRGRTRIAVAAEVIRAHGIERDQDEVRPRAGRCLRWRCRGRVLGEGRQEREQGCEHGLQARSSFTTLPFESTSL